MRIAPRSIAALGAVFFVSVGVAACGGGIPGDAVVQVKSTPITKSTFDHWMTIASASSTTSTGAAAKVVVPEPPKFTACIAHLKETEPKPAKGQTAKTSAELKTECEEEYKAEKEEVLGYLISSQWVIGQAEEMKVTASNKEVEKKFDALKKEEFPKESEFKKFLESSRETVSDLLLRVKVQDVLSTKIEEKVTKEAKKTPSKAEVAKYYKEHESTYGKPERRDLNIVLTKTEAQASSAKSEIEGGKSFASVAKAVSIETASKGKGGALAEVEKGQEEKALGEAVFSASTKVLTGPIKTPFGYYVFEVTKVLKATQKPLKSVEAEIKEALSSQREETALTKFEKEFRKKWTARTECRAGYVVEDCKGYKKPKTTTSTSSTASATSTTSSASSK